MNTKNLVFTLLLSALVLWGCGKDTNDNNSNVEKVVPVEITKINDSEIMSDLTFVGTLSAWKEANLAAQTTARIRKIYVDAGSRVSEGQLLFEMDDTQLAQMKIQLQIAKDNFDRMKPLYDSKSISQSQWDQVKAAYETAEKSYNLLLENTQFRAPFSGVITSKRLNEGEVFLLSPGGLGAPAIVSMMQLNPLKLMIGVSEANLKDVKLNQNVEITTDVYPGEIFKGTVSRIYPQLNTATRTVDVEVRLPNSGERLKPGMYVQAKVATGSTKGILVNRSAVLKMLGSAAYYAFVSLNEKYAKRVDIVVGREFDSKVEILKGLNYGDYIVTKGQSLLKDSTKISVKSKFE